MRAHIDRAKNVIRETELFPIITGFVIGYCALAILSLINYFIGFSPDAACAGAISAATIATYSSTRSRALRDSASTTPRPGPTA